jgi:hypothetical protein
MPSGEAAIAAVCSSRYICSGYSASDGNAAAPATASYTTRELETVTAGCANCACLMRGRRDEASVTHLLSTAPVSPAPRSAAAALYAPCLRRLSEPTDKAAAMREREFFAKKELPC